MKHTVFKNSKETEWWELQCDVCDKICDKKRGYWACESTIWHNQPHWEIDGYYLCIECGKLLYEIQETSQSGV